MGVSTSTTTPKSLGRRSGAGTTYTVAHLASGYRVALPGSRVRARGLTVLLVEHDMRAVMEVSDHVFVLEAGRKIAEGPPQRIARDPAVIAAYLGTDTEDPG